MEKTISDKRQVILKTLLRKTRKKTGLTQIELADLLNEQQSFVSRFESGERRVDLVELSHICETLDIDLVDFVAEFKKSYSGK